VSLILANSLSPVMWRTLGLLLVGNVVIGLLEGLLLAGILRSRVVPTTLLAIAANYLSTWAGFFVILPVEAQPTLVQRLFEQPIAHPLAVIWVSFGVALTVSILVEWPFAKLATGATAPRSLLAVAAVNLGSYCFLLGPVFLDANVTVGRDTRLVDARSIVLPDLASRATLYFLDASDGSLVRMRLDGSERTMVLELGATGTHDVLTCLPPTETGHDSWELRVDRRHGSEAIVMKLAEGRCAAFLSRPDLPFAVRGGWMLGAVGVADLRPAGDRGWVVEPESNQGISVRSSDSKVRYTLCVDTPLGSWWGRSVTMLPEQLAVFELGQQICVLSIPTREVATLARGRGPVVVWDEQVDAPRE
jgi:hypothetical protein